MALFTTLFPWWHDADFVVRGVFIVLILLSLVTWTLIIFKAAQFHRTARAESIVLQRLTARDSAEPCSSGSDCPSHRIAERYRRNEIPIASLESSVAHDIGVQRLALESYLTTLATIGNSAPFIGLLGTVWGIMRALQGLDSSAGLSLEVVAGPVAEALVATAMGLFAAIPAVIGYNLLLRRLRWLMAGIESNVRHMVLHLPKENPAGNKA